MANRQAMTKPGTFYGLGVGPGDPELMTVKAWRILSTVPVVAYPRADLSESLARRIAQPFISETAIEVEIAVPMRSDRQPAQAAYDAAARELGAHLDAGRDVGFLCEGDPLFYGSFMYLLQRLRDSYPTAIVPGVTSLTAAAAALGRPLAARTDVLKVIPATAGMDRLAAELATAEAAAIIKVGRHFDQVRAVIDRLGLSERAFVIEAATRSDEKVTKLSDLPDGAKPYFSTILIYRGSEPW